MSIVHGYAVPSQLEERLRASGLQCAAEAADELARLRTENRDLRSIPWPRAYVLERASEWTRLLREVGGYLKTCRGSCGSDMAGRDHAIAASDALTAMLSEARTAAETGSVGMSEANAPIPPVKTGRG